MYKDPRTKASVQEGTHLNKFALCQLEDSAERRLHRCVVVGQERRHNENPTKQPCVHHRCAELEDLIAEPWQMENGRVAIPGKPGLGIEVNMDTVEQYQTQQQSFAL